MSLKTELITIVGYVADRNAIISYATIAIVVLFLGFEGLNILDKNLSDGEALLPVQQIQMHVVVK